MAYKINYGLERAERNRAKQAKKEAKLREKKAGLSEESQGGDDAAEAPAKPEDQPE